MPQQADDTSSAPDEPGPAGAGPGGDLPRTATAVDLTWDLPGGNGAAAAPPPATLAAPAANGVGSPGDMVSVDAAPKGSAEVPPTAYAPPVRSQTLAPHDATIDAHATATPLPPRPAGSAGLPETIGPYRVIEKVGEGGMGVVYRAEQLFPVRRTVALKVIKIGMDTQEVVARFEAERQALALMDHPNVARVFEAGMTDAGRPYFAMEFVPGVPLVEFCDQQRLTVRQRLELFVLVCNAVQHAHQKGIIHRDLKPSNILVARLDGRPVPKVIDFGIAKATTQRLTEHHLHTKVGALVGTPEYASPEQAGSGGMDVDTRSDIYSLGVILYQLLTGTLPLDPATLRRDGPEGVARILREVDPPSPSSRISKLRRDRGTRVAGGRSDSGSGGAADARNPSGNGGGTDGRSSSVVLGTTFVALAAARRADPRSFSRALRGDLDWITLKAMEKDRQHRYATAHDLAADVRRYLADEPILARPPSARYRVAKFVRKHRAPVAAAAVMLLLLVGGVVGTSVGLARALSARSAAEVARVEAEQARVDAERAGAVATTEGKRAADALAALRAAEAQADAETRRSVAAGIAAAAKAADDRSSEAPGLADLAEKTAAAAFGPDDPLALEAAAVHGRALLSAGKHRQAESVLRDVIARVEARPATGPAGTAAAVARGSGPRALRGRAYADLADAVRQQRDGGDAAGQSEVLDLYRKALVAFRTDGEWSKARLEAGVRMAGLLRSAGRLPGAATAYRDALADHAKLLGEDDPKTREVMDHLASVLVADGKFAEALPLVERQLRRAGDPAHPTETLIGRMIDRADLLLRLGADAEGKQAWDRAIAAQRKLRPGSDGLIHQAWRRLVLRTGLGAGRTWASPTLRGNAWLVLEPALARSPAPGFAVDELRWDEARFKLYRWDGDAGGHPADRPAAAPADLPPVLAAGSLDDLRRLPDPPPGLYYLALDVPRRRPEALRGGTFVLMADWRLKLFQPGPDFTPSTRTNSLWSAMGRRPAATDRLPSLLMLDDGNDGDRVFGVRVGQGPGGRVNDFGVDATADVRLPPGRYRVAVSSDDGVRVHLDDATVVNAWRARALQTDAVPVTIEDRPYHVRVEYFQGVGEYILRFAPEPISPRADALVAAAVGDDGYEFRRWLLRQGREMELLGRWPEAADYYRRATELGSRLAGVENDQLFQSLRGVGRAFGRTGRAAEAGPFLETLLDGNPSPEVAAETLLAAARQRLLAGEGERARELAARAIDAAGEVTKSDRGRGRDLLREAVLIRLGAPLAPHDGGLAAQLYCAVDEAMIEDRQLPGVLRDSNPADVAWSLYRWRPGKPEALVAEGTAADLPAGTPPMEAGVYLLRLRLAGADAVWESAHWVLAATWDSAAYTPDGEGAFDRQQYLYMTNNLRRPAGRADLAGLAQLAALGGEPVPPGPAYRFAMVSQARVKVPPGRYRLVVTGTDGVRVHVDDRRVVNTWPGRQRSRPDVADVELGALSHGLRVDHYQAGAEGKLWLRLEPLDPGARAMAARLGRQERPAKSVLADQEDAIGRDAYNATAFATRGLIQARAGNNKPAATDFAAAHDIDQNDSLWWQYRLGHAAATGDRAGYELLVRQLERRMADNRSPDGKDRHAAARTAIVLLLDDRPDVATGKAVLAALSQATTPSPVGDTPPPALVARAMHALRTGHPHAAERLSTEAAAASEAPGHRVLCEYVAAWALRAKGDQAAARDRLTAADAALAAWQDDGRRWDLFEGVDWLACKAIRAKVAGAAKGGD